METSCETAINRDSDRTLVAAAKRGETLAFDELILRHRHRILYVAQRITNNREDAEDVVQECLHKAFLHLGDFQEKSRFSTWLTRIAMNEALMALRRKRGLSEVLSECPDHEAKPGSESFVDISPDPEEACWRHERAELLTAAIERLTPTIRTVIILRGIEERSAKETAQILGASIAAVKTRLSHGRRKLRSALNTRLLRRQYACR
jgi:RNA polymerase sigma-70 factor, ECF subfamily